MRVTFGIVVIRAKTRSPLLQFPGPNKIKTGYRNAICSTQLLLSPLIYQSVLWTRHSAQVFKLRDLPIQNAYFWSS